MSMTGIQLDTVSYRDRDSAALCAELAELAPITDLFCFFADEDLRRGRDYHGGTDLRCGPTQCDAAGRDAIDRLLAGAGAAGMRVHLADGELAWFRAADLDPAARQVDCFGRPRHTACVNHPQWRAFQIAVHADAFHQHPELAGFLFMHERAGPFLQIFKPEAWQGAWNPGCFCSHCCELAQARGIDSDRARTGLQALVHLFRDGAAADFRDGAMVALWRCLSRHPEALAWERFQWDSLHAYRAAVAAAIRAARPGAGIGYHCQHGSATGDLPWRAGDEAAAVLAYADWIKPSVYPGCSGQRYRHLLDHYRRTWLRDCSLEDAHRMLSAWFGRNSAEGSPVLADDAGQCAFGPDWVRSEVARMVAAADPKPIYAGLGIGVPGGEEVDDRALITACTEACFEAGAAGILFSRHYSEMPPELLAAAGDVVRAHDSALTA